MLLVIILIVAGIFIELYYTHMSIFDTHKSLKERLIILIKFFFFWNDFRLRKALR